jgi:hypothetical protein
MGRQARQSVRRLTMAGLLIALALLALALLIEDDK